MECQVLLQWKSIVVALQNTGKWGWWLLKFYTLIHLIHCNYFQRAAEGKTVQVPYKGPLQSTIQDILGGLRSSCTYVGAAKLKELSKRTTFVRVTQQANEVFSSNTINK